MAIEVIEGKVNISGNIKETGSRIQLPKAEEERLIKLGFAKEINADEKIENIKLPKQAEK